MCRQERQKQMRSLFEQWKQSNYSQRKFAILHQININTFRYWIIKFQKEDSSPEGFVELTPHSSASESQEQLCLRYPNGVELFMPVSTPPQMLQELIHI